MSDAHAALIKGGLAALLGVVVSCARADAASAGAERVMTIGCRIQVTADGGAIRLEARARSRASVTGRYRFDVRKSGASGSSQNSQSGDFNLDANQEEILSTTFLGVTDADRYQARLVLDSNFGSVSCVSP
jgi:hypothetical protein